MKKANTHKQSPVSSPIEEPIKEVSQDIELLVLDNNIPLHGTLINKFSCSDFIIQEQEKGGHTWFSIRNSKTTIFVPINRISYIVYKTIKH